MKNLLGMLGAVLIAISGLAQGSCNEADLQYMADNAEALTTITTDCGLDCFADGDPEGCVVACITSQTPLSDDCALCFAEQVACVSDNCFLVCLFGSTDDCNACVAANCLAPWQECAGIVDEDGDGFTILSDCNDNVFEINPDATEIWYDGVDQNCDGLNDFDQDQDGDDAFAYGGTDCDDTNPNTFNDAMTFYVDGDMDGYGDSSNSLLECVQPPGTSTLGGDCNDANDTVYPDAPGTQEGIDNNCNGVIEPAEAYQCEGDFNNDGIVNTNDLLVMLADLGCVGDCTADMNNSLNVDTSDLLLFLAVFGLFC